MLPQLIVCVCFKRSLINWLFFFICLDLLSEKSHNISTFAPNVVNCSSSEYMLNQAEQSTNSGEGGRDSFCNLKIGEILSFKP